MKSFARLKNNKLIKLFAVLFMTLNLVLVMIGGISCIYTVNMFKNVITEYNVASIDNVRTLMDTRLTSGERLAQDIYLSVNLSDLSGNESIYTPQNRFLITKLINSIQYGVNTNGIIADAYIYLARSDTVISNKGFFEADFFYQNYVPHKDMTFEQWKQSLIDMEDAQYRASDLKFSSYEMSVTEYFKPFNLYSRDLYGCIVINYDNQAILDILNRNKLLSDASAQIRYVPTNSCLINVGNEDVNKYIQTQEIITGQQMLDNTPYGNLVVVKQTSVDKNWEYITVISTDVFYTRIDTIITIMVVIVLFQFGLGLLLAFLFSTRSYLPIKHMTDHIKSIAKDMDANGADDDLIYIKDVVSAAVGNYGKAKEELDSVRPMIMKSFLSQLLHGNRSEREYAQSRVGDKLDFFKYNGFICAKIAIEECDEFTNEQTIEEMQLVRLVITNITQEILGDSVNFVDVDFDLQNIVFIFNLSYETDKQTQDEYMENIENLLKKSQTIIESKFKIYTSIGISRLNEGVQSLYHCHLQADRALEQKIVSGVYGINYYREHSASHNNYSYSLEDEIYLINSTKTGAYDKVCKILDEVVEDNSAIFTGANLSVAQCFMIDLLSTLLRAAQEVNVPSELIDLNVASLLALNSYPKMMQEIYKYYEILCDWINKNKKSHNTLMKDRIEDYISRHYLDNSLSLVSVADHLGMNPTYLSVFIKEQFGETFLNYVLQMRMEKSKELLRDTDMSLQDIATQIGYANSGVFIRVFKKKYGHTPGTYRSNNQKIM